MRKVLLFAFVAASLLATTFRGGAQEAPPAPDVNAPRPIDARDSVWIE
jgi:hypothetical protein